MANNGTAPRVESVGFDDLAQLAHRLNSSSDALNTAIRRIETRLNELGLGLAFFVPIEVTRNYVDDGREHGLEEFEEDQLGYDRIGDSWGLAVRHAHFTDNPDPDSDPELCWEFSDLKPLLRSSRETRIQAVAEIPALFRLLKTEAEKILQVVEQAQRLADDGVSSPDAPPDETALRVPCMVSELALQFGADSSLTGGGEFIPVDIVKGQNPGRRLHQMFVSRKDITRALSLVRVTP
jgi:hypothetical protein